MIGLDSPEERLPQLSETAGVAKTMEEMKLRQDRFQQLDLKQQVEEMRQRYPFIDQELAERIIDAGFFPDSVLALAYAPIAIVAWGSGSVTEQERLEAANSVRETALRGNSASIAQFSGWFDERPSPSLLELWSDFMRAHFESDQPSTRRATIDLLNSVYVRASGVASASGGFFGVGSVCHGESEVISFIEQIVAEAG